METGTDSPINGLFGKSANGSTGDQQELIAKLHRIIGEIKMENNWLNKLNFKHRKTICAVLCKIKYRKRKAV